MKTLRYIFSGLLLMLAGFIHGQSSPFHYNIELNGIGSTGNFAPFWFQSKNYGKISSKPNSISCQLEFFKPFVNPDKKFEIAYGLKLNTGIAQSENPSLFIQEAYIKGRWLIFDMSIGMEERKSLITDSELSTGDLLISQNFRPIPQIRAGIEEFTAIPFTKGYAEIRGALAHGWFADGVFAPGIMFHHKFAHVRLGGKLPFRLQYGFEHAAEWGGNIPGNGDQSFTLSKFARVFLAKSGDGNSSNLEQANALGNHIISTHLKAEGRIGDFNINAYWINMLEDRPVRLFPWLTMNTRDGLWGLNISHDKLKFFKGFVYEYMNTLDNSGPWHDKDGIIYGGLDSYFRNVIYNNDWAHFGRTIGNPLILSPVFNQDGNYRIFYNHVRAHHMGINGSIGTINYKVLGTFADYYIYNQKPAHRNIFWMIEAGKKLPELEDMELTVKIGGNAGDIPGNTTGLMISIRKAGILFPK
jgi:hypothetical protein